MVEIRDFIPGDEVVGDDYLWREPVGDSFVMAFFSKTILHNDIPIGIIGANYYSNTVGIIFMVVSDKCIEVGKQFSEMVQMIIDTEPQQHGVKKLYALIDSEKQVNIDWIERFGFEHEYTMKKAGNNNQDMLGYAWERS